MNLTSVPPVYHTRLGYLQCSNYGLIWPLSRRLDSVKQYWILIACPMMIHWVLSRSDQRLLRRCLRLVSPIHWVSIVSTRAPPSLSNPSCSIVEYGKLIASPSVQHFRSQDYWVCRNKSIGGWGRCRRSIESLTIPWVSSRPALLLAAMPIASPTIPWV